MRKAKRQMRGVMRKYRSSAKERLHGKLLGWGLGFLRRRKTFRSCRSGVAAAWVVWAKRGRYSGGPGKGFLEIQYSFSLVGVGW